MRDLSSIDPREIPRFTRNDSLQIIRARDRGTEHLVGAPTKCSPVTGSCFAPRRGSALLNPSLAGLPALRDDPKTRRAEGVHCGDLGRRGPAPLRSESTRSTNVGAPTFSLGTPGKNVICLGTKGTHVIPNGVCEVRNLSWIDRREIPRRARNDGAEKCRAVTSAPRGRGGRRGGPAWPNRAPRIWSARRHSLCR